MRFIQAKEKHRVHAEYVFFCFCASWLRGRSRGVANAGQDGHGRPNTRGEAARVPCPGQGRGDEAARARLETVSRVGGGLFCPRRPAGMRRTSQPNFSTTGRANAVAQKSVPCVPQCLLTRRFDSLPIQSNQSVVQFCFWSESTLGSVFSLSLGLWVVLLLNMATSRPRLITTWYLLCVPSFPVVCRRCRTLNAGVEKPLPLSTTHRPPHPFLCKVTQAPCLDALCPLFLPFAVDRCNPRKFLESPLYVSHVGKSMYAMQLERWFDLFGRDNFKVSSAAGRR